MSDSPSSHDRRRDLLAEQALFGLGAEELRELSQLGGDQATAEEFALTAAALDLGLHGDALAHETLPAHLRQRTLDAVRQAAGEDRKIVPLVPGSSERRVAGEAARRDWLGWAVAAAAIAVAAFSFSRQPAVSEPTAVEIRSELLALKKQDPAAVVVLDWTKSEDATAESIAKNATGKVLWSDKLQRGVMEFEGLAANNPKQDQYQLWIFDASRPEATPVDGGVFNIPAGEKNVLVPIDARLPITKATLFAITVEPPGGVVVSDRSRLPLLAAVPKPEGKKAEPSGELDQDAESASESG